MTLEPKKRETLYGLVDALCDEQLDDADHERLAALLADDDALWLYVAHMNMHAGLAWDFGLATESGGHPGQAQDADAMLTDERQVRPSVLGLRPSSALLATPSFFSTTLHGTIGYFSSGWPVAYLVATVILGVGLLIGTLVHVSQPAQVVRQSVPSRSPLAPSPSAQPFVGRITGMIDCQSADPQTEAFNGAYVPLGRKYALSSGLMEITYDTGAKVILHGPITYKIESIAGGFLSVGKLTARVEKKATRLPLPFGRGAGGGLLKTW
jgi:hypothetical protein